MKKYLCLICICMLSNAISAQTQQGIVKTKGRMDSNGSIIVGSPISDAYVTVLGTQTVTSNKDGKFSVGLKSKEFYLKEVTKEGYVLCDADILSRSYAYSLNPLYIVMETPAQQMEDKLLAERKLRRTLQRQLQQREDEIDSLKTKQQISDEEYHRQLQQIYAEQEENEKLITEMSERYAGIDYDQLDEFNRQIRALILEGKLTKADSLIRTKGDLSRRHETFKNHQKQLAEEEAELRKKQTHFERNKVSTQKEMEDLAQDYYSLYEIYKMQHKNDSAAYYLELRASLDTTNVEWQLEAGDFIEAYLANYDKALQYFQYSLIISKKQFGDKYIEVARCMNNIGNIYAMIGKYHEAEKYLNESLRLKEQILGKLHPELAQTYDNLGLLFQDLGKYDEASEYYQKCLKIREKNKSVSVKDLFQVTFNIASLNETVGKYEVALEGYQRCLELIKNEDYNEDDNAKVYNNIGHTYHVLSKLDDAKEMYENALKIWLPIYGERHPKILAIYTNLGALYSDMGEYNAALSFKQKAIEIGSSIYGSKNPKMITAYVNIGTTYENIGNYAEAMKWTIDALDIAINSYGERHPNVATIYNNIGGIWGSVRQHEKAISFYEKALSIQKSIYGEDNHADIARSYGNIGVAYHELKKYPKAIESLTKSLEIEKKTIGEEHTSVGSTYLNLAGTYSAIGDTIQAAQCYQKATNIFTKHYGEKHPMIAQIYGSMALNYYHTKQYEKAVTLYQKAAELRCEIFGDTSIIVADTYNSIAYVYYSMQDIFHSFMYMEKVFKIKSHVLGEDNPKLHNLYNGIYMCFLTRPELRTQKWTDFYEKKMIISGVVSGNEYPAAQKGMEGTYYILEFGTWNCASNGVFDFSMENQRLQGQPKNLVVYQNGIISEHHFDDVIGMRFEVTYTGEDGKKSMIELYNNWKK